MASMAVTRMSSKGQIVIPSEMRMDSGEGTEFLILKDEDVIILKRAEKVSEQMKEDLEFARRTEQAWKQIEKGDGIEMEFDDFIEKMKKW